MSDKDRRREEKERLWNEVLGRKRAYENEDGSDDIVLSVEETAKHSNETLKSANDAMEELNRILRKQQKDLENLSNEMKKDNRVDPSLMDMDQLEKDLQMDFGMKQEKPADIPAAAVQPKSADPADFQYAVDQVNEAVYGQSDAVRQLVTAYRRPFVMGENNGKPRNVIIVSGPPGSGKHEAIAKTTRALYERQV
ncbi:MAG: hypothetical protein IKG55_04980, partial [Solobacterium sp.]|nr:hypothetical protein [Solobacterium sp.]